MQKLTKVQYVTIEQHKDRSPARMRRDDNDFHSILQFLIPKSLFWSTLAKKYLQIFAHEGANAYDAENKKW